MRTISYYISTLCLLYFPNALHSFLTLWSFLFFPLFSFPFLILSYLFRTLYPYFSSFLLFSFLGLSPCFLFFLCSFFLCSFYPYFFPSFFFLSFLYLLSSILIFFFFTFFIHIFFLLPSLPVFPVYLSLSPFPLYCLPLFFFLSFRLPSLCLSLTKV